MPSVNNVSWPAVIGLGSRHTRPQDRVRSTRVDCTDNFGMTARHPTPSYADSVLDRALLPRLFDGALAVLVTAIGVTEIWVPFASVQGEGPRATSTALVLILGLSLALRRVMPLTTALVVFLTWPVPQRCFSWICGLKCSRHRVRSSPTGACSSSLGGLGGGFVPWSGGPRSRCSAPSMSRRRRLRTRWRQSLRNGPASRVNYTTWSRNQPA